MIYLETNKNLVSIWIGVTSSEERLLDYCEDHYDRDEDTPLSEFCADFDIDGIDEDFREVSCCEMTTSLTRLLNDFSYAERLLPHALAANNGDLLSEPVNAAVVLYGYIMPAARGHRGACKDPAMKFFGVVDLPGMRYGPNPDE